MKFGKISHYSFLLFLVISCSNVKTDKGKVSSYNFHKIDTLINSWICRQYYPGAGLIIGDDRSIIYKKYYGNYDSSTVAYIASSGKWLAAATIAALVDEGKLSWNDKVVKWIPSFTDIKGQATLRQLLSHTSGFPNYQPKGVRKDDYQSLVASVKHIIALKADNAPGERFHYGGLAMQVAGRMAELATGEKWQSIFETRIAKPLGMNHTFFVPVDSAGGHSPMLAGGARSTLEDYGKFLKMILNNGIFDNKQILSTQAIMEMEKNQVKGAKVDTGEFVQRVRNSQRKDIYGLGEWRELIGNDGNAIVISSPSWAGAYPWIDKKYGIYGFFLAHVDVNVVYKKHFSGFYTSPVLMNMVRDAIQLKNKN